MALVWTLGAAPTLGVLVGAVSFGFAGFAFGLFATAALALSSPPEVVVPAVMLLADTLALPLLWEHRQHLRRDQLAAVPPFAPWSLPLLLAGIAVGSVLLGRVTPTVGRLALAGVVLAFVGVQAFGLGPRAPSEAAAGSAAARAAALAGGLLDGWLGTGGVVIVVYLTWRRFAPGAFVTGLLAYFLVADSLRAVSYAAFGYWSRASLDLYLATLPVALLGYLGGVLLRRALVSVTVFRAGVLLLLTLYGLALIRGALTQG